MEGWKLMRQNILKMLIDNMGEFISGEDMSDILGVTRAAIWKHIEILRQDGYVIESVPRKGYKLVEIPDTIDEYVIKGGLSTKLLGTEILSFDVVDSTNAVAKEKAIAGCREGTIIIADKQTGGRGRMGRDWVSPSGKGVWMSIVLRPSIVPTKAPLITSMAAVAVMKAIQRVTDLNVSIKWPNDILIDGKKVCGILTEMQGDMDIIHYVVVGIGINVNLEETDFPKELRDKATSLKMELGVNVRRVDIIQVLLKELEDIYLDYINKGNSNAIITFVKENSATVGNRICVIGVDTSIEGRAIDIDDNGALVVKLDDGQIRKIMSGDVSVRGVKGYV